MPYVDLPPGFFEPVSNRILTPKKTFTMGLVDYRKGELFRADHRACRLKPHLFREVNSKRVVKATQWFTLGGRRIVAAGALFRDDDPIVVKNGWLFAPLVDPEPEPEQLEEPGPELEPAASSPGLLARLAGRR